MSDSLFLLDLPQDILEIILKNLHLTDLRNLMLTCNGFRTLIKNNNSLWRFISKHYLIINALPKRSKGALCWYDKCRISHNWKFGIYREKVAISHNENYMPWLKVESDNLLLSVGSELRCYTYERKTGIGKPRWRVEVPKVRRYGVRTNDISRFAVCDDILACGNRDGCTAVYKFDRNGKKRPSLIAHLTDCHDRGSVEVSDVDIFNTDTPLVVLTVSNHYRRLSTWRVQDNPICSRESCGYNHKYVIESNIEISHVIGLRCLSVDHKQCKLVIGPNGNSSPVLFDLETYQVILNAKAPVNADQCIRDISWHDSHTVLYSTHSGRLKAMDVRIGENVFEAVDPFLSPLYCVRSDSDRTVVCGAAQYARCVLFDLRMYAHHVQTYFTQKKSSPVYSLEFDQTRLITAADRSVAVLNFNVNVGTTKRRDYSDAFEVVHSTDI